MAPSKGRARSRRGFEVLSAFALYAAMSFALIGRPVAGAISESYIGKSNDPSVYMWALAWWPHAIAHHLNPIISRVVWAPRGFNLAWTTSMPLAAVLAAPLTRIFGAVVTYNLLCILAPVLAAWSCFLLCRRCGGNYRASLMGGYLFGFSAYVLAEIRAHLPLVWVFPLPLAALFALEWFDGRISGARFTIRTGVVLVTAFLLWPELYATMTLFAAIALLLAIAIGDRTTRADIRALIRPLAGAYAISLVAVLPYLYYFFQPGYPHSSINSPGAYSSDLLNFVIPTPVNALGTLGLFERLSRHFPGGAFEAGAYAGLPLIAITAWYGYERWRDFEARLLVAFLACTLVLTMGPRLHVGGSELFGMPWKLALHLPLLHHALPARLSIYGFLGLAVAASLWLSAQRPVMLKAAAVLLLAISLCPNLDPEFWRRPLETPAFFANGDFRSYLKPAENVIAVPYGLNGVSMLWQAESGFYFRMAGGWTSITPREFQSWPIVGALLSGTYIPAAPDQLRAFMAAHDADLVIADDRSRFWMPLLSAIDPRPAHIGGVLIYRTSPAELAGYRGLSAVEMERGADDARFAALLAAARAYLARGEDPAALSPMRVQQLGFLPEHWVRDPDVRSSSGLYLGPWGRDQVAAGVVGSYPALEPLIAKYRMASTEIFFPFPKRLVDPPRGDTFMRLLVMVFDRAGLARAANLNPAPDTNAAAY